MTLDIHGGRRKVNAVSPVKKIMEAACDIKFVATFDYSLAFDFANPSVALEILGHSGAAQVGLAVPAIVRSSALENPAKLRSP